ncbi:MAG: hypothetical protein ACP6IY_16635 [Promethearchaeia archaeon]
MTEILNEILSRLPNDIKYYYLIFYTEFRYTGITAYRKGYYTLNNLKDDVRRNMIILFDIDNNEFNNLWENYISIFKTLNIDLFEILNRELCERIMSNNKEIIQNYLINKISELSKNEKKALLLYFDKFYSIETYLFKEEKFNKLFKLIFDEELSDSIQNILIKSGLGMISLWITSNNNNNGLQFEKISFPIDIINKIKDSALSDITYPSFKKEFKIFKKRFNYKKNRKYFIEAIGLDLLFSGYEQIEDALNIIIPEGMTKFLSHPKIVERDIINPFIQEELWEFVKESAKYLLTSYNWLAKLFEKISTFSFREESNDFYQIFNHEINNEQYHVIISSWYKYSLPIEENSILILLYHSNIRSLIENIFDSEVITCIIAFDENEDIYLIGNQEKIDLFNLIFNFLEEKGYKINKKILSNRDSYEYKNKHLINEPDILKKILDLLEKHDAEVNYKLDNINKQLKEKLGNDYQKLKEAHEKLKNNEITRRKYYAIVGKIIVKHSLAILNLFF